MACDNLLIAVVDDESSVRVMLRRVLRLAKYEVQVFENGQAFLDAIASHRPSCAVIDVHMDGLSGLDVSQRIQSAGMHMPIVLITASDDPAIDLAAVQVGAQCLLRKPFSSEALLAAISDAIGTVGVDA